MTRDDVQAWLDRYLDAWRAGDPAALGELFAEDATHWYHAWDPEPVTGRARLVADWMEVEDREGPGSWTARYEPFVVDGDRAVAVGESRYVRPDGTPRTTYYNAWTLRFDEDGRCADFVEHFDELPADDGPGG